MTELTNTLETIYREINFLGIVIATFGAGYSINIGYIHISMVFGLTIPFFAWSIKRGLYNLDSE